MERLTNKEIVSQLREVMAAMEIKGADKFRLRAYQNAVAAIDNLTSSAQDLWENGRIVFGIFDRKSILYVFYICKYSAAFAGEQVPRTGREVKIVYDEVFLPPHIEARYELERIQEEWSAQELFDLISRQEESDEENF